MRPHDNSESSIRVVVVNESGFICEGLSRVIERFKGIDAVASLQRPQDLGDVAQQLRADVALIDAQFPSQAGFEAALRLRESGVETRVVIISVNPNLSEVERVLHSGAHGFLLREAGVSELEIALHAAVRGEKFLCPTILQRLPEGLTIDAMARGVSLPTGIAQARYSVEDILTKALKLGILQQKQ
ncbi:MAG: hypothetical protein CME75_03980 [Halomonas sp.]|nr:hypothetical protein [Halomonas sp.]